MKALIIIGSDSDLSYVEKTKSVLDYFEINSTIRIASAHRTPEHTHRIIEAANQDCDVIIAAAGLAAHLPGVCAASTTLPVIGIPIDNGPLRGNDALLSIVMMPPGVPVGSMGIGDSGARNAGVYAAQIMALKYPEIKEKLIKYKKEMADKVIGKDTDLNK